MPIRVGTYVRYWSGNAAAYGVVTEVRDATYRIRVGGTSRVVEVPHAGVGLHTALVASGRGGDHDLCRRVDVENRYLYHATSCDLLPAIAVAQGLKPRSRVNWAEVGDDVWTGAEKASGRVNQVAVTDRDYFSSLRGAASRGGGVPSHYLLGDVGEFFYAAKSHHDVLINYVGDISRAGKTPIVARFKTRSMAWYQDPKSTGAVMTMNVIPLQGVQLKLVGRGLQGVAHEDDLVDALADDHGWVSCSEPGWLDEILALRLEDLFRF